MRSGRKCSWTRPETLCTSCPVHCCREVLLQRGLMDAPTAHLSGLSGRWSRPHRPQSFFELQSKLLAAYRIDFHKRRLETSVSQAAGDCKNTGRRRGKHSFPVQFFWAQLRICGTKVADEQREDELLIQQMDELLSQQIVRPQGQKHCQRLFQVGLLLAAPRALRL